MGTINDLHYHTDTCLAKRPDGTTYCMIDDPGELERYWEELVPDPVKRWVDRRIKEALEEKPWRR